MGSGGKIKMLIGVDFKTGDKVEVLVDSPEGSKLKKGQKVVVAKLYKEFGAIVVVTYDNKFWAIPPNTCKLIERPKL